MSPTLRSTWLLSFLLTFACGAPPSGRTCETNGDCGRGSLCIDGLCQTNPGPDASVFTAIRIEPTSAELLAVDGATPSQAFRAFVTGADGAERPAMDVEFSVEEDRIGSIDAEGTFYANGSVGGVTTITARLGDLMATATVTVRVERALVPAELADAPARFDAATPVDDAARRAGLVYPLEGAVMPRNVFPADIQWTNGAAGDVFRITMSKPNVELTAYVAHDGMNHWLAERAAWRTLAISDPDAQASITVDRLIGGELITGAPISMTFARATLSGSVYYWDIAAGRIKRIDDGSGTAVSFMPNPPAAIRTGERCVGCHTVSNSGRYMVGRLGGGDNQGAVFDLSQDLTADPAPTVWPISTETERWWFSDWSPDDTRLVVTYADNVPAEREFRFLDPFTGARIAVTGTSPSGTHPDWSPDGSRIAYVTNIDPPGGPAGWGGAFHTGDIAILPVESAGDPVVLGAPTVIHTGASVPGSTAASYPTWSPDSARLAFASGSGCRSETDTAQLYIMNPDGSGVTPLAQASGAEPLNYQPRFSPFEAGGYYWLSFLSRRVYGNPQIGNSTSPAGLRQQIWVTAIRVDTPAGEDPSAVPFWLPGQDPKAANISAYWARPVPQ